MRQLIAANWKMNGLGSALPEIEYIAEWAAGTVPKADLLICPPTTLLARAAALVRGRVVLGGQDCHPEAAGAFTGDISAEMLKDAGAEAVIVGHSERRRYHCESDTLICAKARAAWRAGLMAILCVGETDAERDGAHAHTVVSRQIELGMPPGATPENTAIAYEPVWAIGTGRTPQPDDIVDMHGHIRARLGASGGKMRILYGGSVSPANAKGILALPGVDGALVGGASLKARDFQAIITAARE
jgi:triosephosphate isomerase (TIM)